LQLQLRYCLLVTAEPRRRPGGRSARVRDAVLTATLEDLVAHGFDALTVEAVATRAGVHKTTVYRQFGTKERLVGAALAHRSQARVPVPDTGRLADDLLALARSVVANVTSAGGAAIVTSMVKARGEAAVDAETAAFWAERLALTATIVERAIERGEAHADVEPRVVVELLVAPIYFRMLLTGEPIDDAFLEPVVETVVRGVQARPSRRSNAPHGSR
jgi:AcrR family transcriptional regulator